MKKLVLISVFLMGLVIPGLGQHVSSDSGKTYYDEAKTKLKEVYSFKKIPTLNPKENPEGKVKKQRIKHGPYFYYYKNGQIKISGRYKDGKKHGEWKYYKQDGTISKIEKYRNGKEEKVIENPKQPENKSGNVDL